ncbi:hypothetical protein [Erwinia phage vB_Ea277G]|nr:hypothetical protein [Erwinia phage vB_Ea277G]
MEMMLARSKAPLDDQAYQDFLTWLQGGKLDGVTIQSGAMNTSLGNISRPLKIVCNQNPSGTMWGSPWNTKVTYDSNQGRVIQHCFPDVDTMNENILKQRTVLFNWIYQGSYSSYASVNRNGYASVAYGTFNGGGSNIFIYFDAKTKRMMQLMPSVGGTPTVWTPPN